MPIARRGLRQKLMELSTTLTAIGVVLLAVGLVAVLWLRSNANRLATERTPAVVATQRVQIGLQRSLAGLRGWVALGDERFRGVRHHAWQEQIEPAMAEVERLRHTWPDPDDDRKLDAVAELLVELKESQWWVEDVAQDEGNRRASHLFRRRVEPIAAALHKASAALISGTRDVAHGGTVTALQSSVEFRAALLNSEAQLARFVSEGDEHRATEVVRALRSAREYLDALGTHSADLSSSQRAQAGFLAREFPWYEHGAREALEARRSETWNVALYRMGRETLPLTRRAIELLDALAVRQRELVLRDARSIAFTGNASIVLSVLLILLMAALAYALASYRAGQITRPIERLALATETLAAGRLRHDLPVTTDDELGNLTDAFNRMRVKLQESEAALRQANRFVRETFGRYLSDEVVASLLDTPEGLRLGGESRTVTILMTDLRGFTSLASRLRPEQVVALLNRYLGAMVEVVARYGGTVDEFIGDSVLAIFGAPIPRDDHAESAVRCALAMQLAMDGVNEGNRRDGLPEVEMGIGVNTGEVVVGNIGSESRAKYGVVGNPVNLTSRIESYTVGGQVLVSGATRDEASAELRISGEIEIEAKGMDARTTAYDVRGIDGQDPVVLPERDTALTELDPAIPVRYAVLEGKRLGSDRFEGLLVRASRTGAEVRATAGAPHMSDVRLELLDLDGARVLGELYAKVTGPALGEASAFAIRFTSLGPGVAELLERVRTGTTPE